MVSHDYYAITFPGGGGGGGGTSNKDRCTDRGFEYIGTEVNIPNNGPRNKVCMNKIEIFYHLKIINKISNFLNPRCETRRVVADHVNGPLNVIIGYLCPDQSPIDDYVMLAIY